MANKSVNISGKERAQIEQKAIELFMKTAKARHPDEHFYKEISYDILNYNWSLVTDEMIASSSFKYMPFKSPYAYGMSTGRITLPKELYIYTFNEGLSHIDSIIIQNKRVMPFEKDELNLPERLRINENYAYPFRSYGEERIWISDEIVNRIEEFNNKMEETYNKLTTQLRTLVDVINSCKTTKSFEFKLPNLTNLYPKSVLKKIIAKNEPEITELTEEQQLMEDASVAIATANMLED